MTGNSFRQKWSLTKKDIIMSDSNFGVSQEQGLVLRSKGPQSIVRAAISKLSLEQVVNLGVSGKYMVKLVREMSLSAEELTDLIVIRTDHDGHIPTAVKWMVRYGLSVEEVSQLFRLREAVCAALSDEKKSISLGVFHQCLEAFSELDPDDEDGTTERLCDAIGAVTRRMCYMFPSQALLVICQAAAARGLASFDAAVDAVLENQPPNNWTPDGGYYKGGAATGDGSPGICTPVDDGDAPPRELVKVPPPIGKAKRRRT